MRHRNSRLLFQCFSGNERTLEEDRKSINSPPLSGRTKWKQNVAPIAGETHFNIGSRLRSAGIRTQCFWFRVKMTSNKEYEGSGGRALLVFSSRVVIKGQCAQIPWCWNRTSLTDGKRSSIFWLGTGRDIIRLFECLWKDTGCQSTLRLNVMNASRNRMGDLNCLFTHITLTRFPQRGS